MDHFAKNKELYIVRLYGAQHKGITQIYIFTSHLENVCTLHVAWDYFLYLFGIRYG